MTLKIREEKANMRLTIKKERWIAQGERNMAQ